MDYHDLETSRALTVEANNESLQRQLAIAVDALKEIALSDRLMGADPHEVASKALDSLRLN